MYTLSFVDVPDSAGRPLVRKPPGMEAMERWIEGDGCVGSGGSWVGGETGMGTSGGGPVILGVVDVDEMPCAVFFSINLGLDAVRRYCGAVLAQGGVKIPVELGPGGVAVYVDHDIARREVARGEHAAHDLLKNIVRNGVEAALLPQRIDKGDIRGMRPDLGEQLEVHGIDRLGVLIEEMMDGQIVGRHRGGFASSLAAQIGGQEKRDRGKEEAREHRWMSV